MYLFFQMLSQLVCLPWHDVLINRVLDCLPSSLGPVQNVLKIQVKTGRQFSFVPYLLTCSKIANRLKWFCKCPSRVPVISAAFRYFVIPALFSSQVTNGPCSAFPNTYFRGCCNICQPLILLRADISQAVHLLQQPSDFILKFIQTIRCTVRLLSNCLTALCCCFPSSSLCNKVKAVISLTVGQRNLIHSFL